MLIISHMYIHRCKTNTHVHKPTNTQIHTHIYTHAHSHACTHTHTHTHQTHVNHSSMTEYKDIFQINFKYYTKQYNSDVSVRSGP